MLPIAAGFGSRSEWEGVVLCGGLGVLVWAKSLREKIALYDSGVVVTPAWRRRRRYRYDQIVAVNERDDHLEILFRDRLKFSVYLFHGNPTYVRDIPMAKNPELVADREAAHSKAGSKSRGHHRKRR